ncbi:techylectin-5B-like [Apostichopus japonicus]|uniref:techylectin-5B-like n=1 Tax=Stichopus japonicus TaxID=307972 RepID=UPI003AB48EB2
MHLLALILVSIATDGYAQGSPEGGCRVSNPYVQSITISDAQIQFQELLGKIQRLAGKMNIPFDVSSRSTYPVDCDGVRRKGSGVYLIRPAECVDPIRVYCDMDTDGGGWLVIQRREDSSVNFHRGWLDYQTGFGSKFSEYWIGNDNLFWLTTQKKYELRVDLEDFHGERKFAVYYKFRVGDSATRYQLQIGDYDSDFSTAGDSLSYHNRSPFTTPDFDNDQATSGNCATHFKSGWWFANCYHANLNGVYRTDGEESNPLGIVWYDWKGLNISLKATEMKIRPSTISIF